MAGGRFIEIELSRVKLLQFCSRHPSQKSLLLKGSSSLLKWFFLASRSEGISITYFIFCQYITTG